MSDAVSPAIRAVLDLFGSELAAVKFPDLDAETLRSAAEVTNQVAEALTRAEAALDQARSELNEAQESLLLKAHRALAYAKVFAEEDPALSTKLEAISLPRAPRRPSTRSLELAPTGSGSPTVEGAPGVVASLPPPKRRGRPPKVLISTNAPLFGPITESEPAVIVAAESSN